MTKPPASPRPLDRETLQKLCTELSEEMRARKARAHVYIVAGRVFTTAWRRNRATPGRDGRRVSDHSALREAVRTVAERHGVPRTWPNDLARAYPPGRPDAPAPVVFNTRYLVATGTSAKYALAMQLEAGPPVDGPGIRALLDILQIRDPDEAAATHARLFPESTRAGEIRGLLQRLTSTPPEGGR